MKSAWARGAEWWRQHGQEWRLVPASSVVWGVGHSVALWMTDPSVGDSFVPLLGAFVLLGQIAWLYWFGLFFVADAVLGRRDLMSLRRLTTGWLILTGLLIAPTALVMPPLLEWVDRP